MGLVGFRCSGKSTVRDILLDFGVPVFDTNSVETGDVDADNIDPRAVLDRYGTGDSYFRFLQQHLRDFASRKAPVWFIDSLKAGKDPAVIMETLPSVHLLIWYLHAPFSSRLARYRSRDIVSGKRTDCLEDHDKSLESLGIITLIKDASDIIFTDVPLSNLREQVTSKVQKLNDLPSV